MTQTTATALGNLRDSIRAEVIAELVGKLVDLWESSSEEHYRDGVNDAILTIHGE